MAEKKNRVIRADDQLWLAVERESARRNEKVPEFVRGVLSEASTTPLCFHCGEPATYRGEANLTPESDVDFDGILKILARGGDLPPAKYTPVRIEYFACDEHDDAASGALLDADLTVSGQILLRSTCDDPWHFDDAAYEAGRDEPVDYGNGWVGRGYRCPSCGFATSGEIVVDKDNPAYVQMSSAVHLLSD